MTFRTACSISSGASCLGVHLKDCDLRFLAGHEIISMALPEQLDRLVSLLDFV
jgi:hypothetical protein